MTKQTKKKNQRLDTAGFNYSGLSGLKKQQQQTNKIKQRFKDKHRPFHFKKDYWGFNLYKQLNHSVQDVDWCHVWLWTYLNNKNE